MPLIGIPPTEPWPPGSKKRCCHGYTPHNKKRKGRRKLSLKEKIGHVVHLNVFFSKNKNKTHTQKTTPLARLRSPLYGHSGAKFGHFSSDLSPYRRETSIPQ
jgi:hypothetical protein